ncbi:hypothetical protein BC827DRAFT_1218568 [Russula dissimulans]|nr:hypothetical protein BC827DRAFT_1218568 [Russula dissimulans]
MRTPSFVIALFLLACHFLSLPVTLASPVAPVELLLRRQSCNDVAGGCRFANHDAPAVTDAFQLSSSPQAATPTGDPQLGAVVTSSSDSASGSTPTSTAAAGSSSSKSNAGVALVSRGRLFSAAFAVLVATVLVF